MKRSCLEIEARAVAELNHRRDELASLTTSIDLLQVHSLRRAEPKVAWNTNLDHDSLLRLVGPEDPGKASAIPALQVFFLGVWGTKGVQAHPSTLDWLQDRFRVSTLFLDCITDINYAASWKTGNASFLKRNKRGKVTVIDGTYRYSSGFWGSAHVWFSYDLETRSATYFLAHCPNDAKEQIVRYARNQHSDLLSRPFAVDTCIVDASASAWQTALLGPRNELIAYERHGASQLPSPAHAFENLHRISRQFHIIYEHLVDFGECLEFLRDMHKTYDTACAELRPGETTPAEGSVDESLVFLMSRNRVWKRWVANYNERTNIRINLFFNLETQSANRTNLEIANLTSKIAIETQRDSSAMITMAAVTMAFLPGTFVSAFFSMVFFHGTDANGTATFGASPQWWYYPVITIPLTIVVFIIWAIWRRQREINRGLVSPSRIEEKMDDSQ